MKINYMVAAIAALSMSFQATAQTVETEALSVWLSVQYHGQDAGFPGTENNAYSCGFDKGKYVLKNAGLITVRLSNDPAMKSRFELLSIRVDGDTAGDYASRAVGGVSGSFYGANTVAQSIYFTVFVRDLITNSIIECDPIVVNEPI